MNIRFPEFGPPVESDVSHKTDALRVLDDCSSLNNTMDLTAGQVAVSQLFRGEGDFNIRPMADS